MKIKLKKKINHLGDWKNYPYSNTLYEEGIIPSKIIDFDGDRIVNWEDCSPWNPNEQGLWSSVKSGYSKAKSFVKSIGPRLQGNNYGTGTNIGGITVNPTGGGTITTGNGGSSSSGGSGGGSVVSGGGSSSGGGGGGGSSNKPIYDSSGNLTGIQDNLNKVSRLPTNAEKFLYNKPLILAGSGTGKTQQQLQNLANVEKLNQERALEQVKKEKERIDALKENLIKSGASTDVRVLTDADTGEKIKTITTINSKGERVYIKTNLTTGKVETRTFEQMRNESGGLISGRTFETGALITHGLTQAKINEIQSKLPKGDTLIYDKNSLTILGIESSILGKSIPWIEKNIQDYDKTINTTPTTKNISDNKIINNLIKNKIIRDVKEIEKYTPIMKKVGKELFSSPYNSIGEALMSGEGNLGFIRGGWEGAKWVYLTPARIFKEETQKGGKKVMESGIESFSESNSKFQKALYGSQAVGGAVLLVGSEFIPTSYGEVASFYGISKLAGAVPKTFSTAMTGLGAYQLGTAENLEDYVRGSAFVGAGILPIVIKQGMKSVRVRQGYKTALSDVEKTYGKNSKEVTEFKKMWNRAFKELPKKSQISKDWSSAQLEESWGNKEIQGITNNLMRKYKPEVIGSTVIKPQTTLEKLPRLKSGDIDIQNVPRFLGKGSKSKQMAIELVANLRNAGYNADMRAGKFIDGTTVYHVRLNGKEFANIHTSSSYFLNTQAGPILKWYEFENIGRWTKDPYGIKMGNIRDQMKVKLWKGFVEKNRPKDIIDAKGIYEGTNSLFSKKPSSKSSFSKKTINKYFKEAIPNNKPSITDYSAYSYGKYSKYSPAKYSGNKLTDYSLKNYNNFKYSLPTSVYTQNTLPKYSLPTYNKSTTYSKPVPTKYSKPKTTYSQTKIPTSVYTPKTLPKYSPPRYSSPIYTQPRYSQPKYSPPRYNINPPIERKSRIIPPNFPRIKISSNQVSNIGYNVYARPLKRQGQKRIPKLKKIPIPPVQKQVAEDIRNYLLDTSLARTGKIKQTKRTAQANPLNVPLGYAQLTQNKFRNYRIIKGKRIPLKNTVIENSPYLIDSYQEKNKIGLAKRISQLRKPKTSNKPSKNSKKSFQNDIRKMMNKGSLSL